MDYPLKLDKNKLRIFHEGIKRRIFVGELIYNKEKDRYEFIYDKKYSQSKNAIPIGPELTLFKQHHYSKSNKLFPSFIDRIPEKSNPAYKDYCRIQNISPNETNSIVLLGSIGKRGPSSFVFEAVYQSNFTYLDIKKFREQLRITQHDFSEAFNINKITLQRLESKTSHDLNTLKRIEILLAFPDVALWQLKQTGERIHSKVLAKLIEYFLQQSQRP